MKVLPIRLMRKKMKSLPIGKDREEDGGDEYLKPKNRGMEGTTNMPLGRG